MGAILDRNLSDEEVCEHIVGDLAGASSTNEESTMKGFYFI